MAMRQLLPGMNIERMDKVVEAFSSGDMEGAKKMIEEGKYEGAYGKDVGGTIRDLQKEIEEGLRTDYDKTKDAAKQGMKDLEYYMFQTAKNTGVTALNTMKFRGNEIAQQ